METWMKILRRPVTTLKDSQRLGRWDRLEVYLSDRERPWMTAKDPVVSFVSHGNKTKYLCRPTTTVKDRQRLAVSKFGAKSSKCKICVQNICDCSAFIGTASYSRRTRTLDGSKRLLFGIFHYSFWLFDYSFWSFDYRVKYSKFLLTVET